MSTSSHPIDIDDIPGKFSELTRLKARHPALVHALEDEYSVSHKFDMPYTAGYSRDRSRYYFDRHLPLVAKLKRRGEAHSVHIRPYILEHEITESALQHVLRIPHEKAHHLATAAEYHKVTQDGIDLASYRAWFKDWIKADEIRASKIVNLKIPPDFDTTPLEADKSHAGRVLLEKVREVMKTTTRSARSWGAQRAFGPRAKKAGS